MGTRGKAAAKMMEDYQPDEYEPDMPEVEDVAPNFDVTADDVKGVANLTGLGAKKKKE